MIVQAMEMTNLSSHLDKGESLERHPHGSMASSSRADMEAARIAEGHAVAAAREARAGGIIQKVERPLKPGFEYMLRRVDHHHPRRATDFTRGGNQSMINRNDDLYEWTTELMTINFGVTSKRIGTYMSSRIGRILSLLSFVLIGYICSKSVIQCSTKSVPKLKY
jgi:hypothetical protein